MNTKNPLDLFVEKLKEQRSDSPIVTNPRHSHTSEPKASILNTFKCDAKCDGPVTLPKLDRDRGLAEEQPDWLGTWRVIAALVDGIQRTDPRYRPILRELDALDRLFEEGKWKEFKEATATLREIITGTPNKPAA